MCHPCFDKTVEALLPDLIVLDEPERGVGIECPICRRGKVFWEEGGVKGGEKVIDKIRQSLVQWASAETAVPLEARHLEETEVEYVRRVWGWGARRLVICP